MALAQDCSEIQTSVDMAYEAFEDAETESARVLIRDAYQALDCQSRVVSPEELMALYHLDALTALAAEDVQGAVYATIRAISADPTSIPPASMGPEISEMHSTWSARLKEARLTLSVQEGGQSLWIDGQKLDAGHSQVVLEGEHLLQMDIPSGFESSVVEVSLKLSGKPPWNVLVESPQPVVPVVAETIPSPPKVAREKNPRRGAKLGVTLAGVAVAVAGGGVLGWGGYEEQQFSGKVYPLEQFEDENGRTDKIRADAARINQMYLVGYGLLGVGIATSSIGLFAMPVSDGGHIGLRGRW